MLNLSDALCLGCYGLGPETAFDDVYITLHHP